MMHKKEVIELIEKAERSTQAAWDLFRNEHFDFAVSRAYYSMFYCAEALLLTKEMSFSKHSAVISFFGKEFIKTKILPKRLHEYLTDAFRDRGVSVYETTVIEREMAERTIKNAGVFINETKKYLEGSNKS